MSAKEAAQSNEEKGPLRPYKKRTRAKKKDRLVDHLHAGIKVVYDGSQGIYRAYNFSVNVYQNQTTGLTYTKFEIDYNYSVDSPAAQALQNLEHCVHEMIWQNKQKGEEEKAARKFKIKEEKRIAKRRKARIPTRYVDLSP